MQIFPLAGELVKKDRLGLEQHIALSARGDGVATSISSTGMDRRGTEELQRVWGSLGAGELK